MTRPRRQQVKKSDLGKPGWKSVGLCGACGKKIYPDKQSAKNAARIRHPDDQLSAYQCRSESPLRPTPAPWHIGHLPEEVRFGPQTRREFYDFSSQDLSFEQECAFIGVNEEGDGLRCSLEVGHVGYHLALMITGDWVNISPGALPTQQQGAPANGTDYLRARSGKDGSSPRRAQQAQQE